LHLTHSSPEVEVDQASSQKRQQQSRVLFGFCFGFELDLLGAFSVALSSEKRMNLIKVNDIT